MNITEFFPHLTGTQAEKASLILMEEALSKNVRLHPQLKPYYNAVRKAVNADPEERQYIFESIMHYDAIPGMVELIEAALDPFATKYDAIATLNGISRYFQYVLPIEEQKRIIANTI